MDKVTLLLLSSIFPVASRLVSGDKGIKLVESVPRGNPFNLSFVTVPASLVTVTFAAASAFSSSVTELG
ncbi:hypothetical protein J6590_027292 [Homalodisca vitripennis]|nr:hypothetical protein J6590_027292 [Homalodisca vitripennis]